MIKTGMLISFGRMIDVSLGTIKLKAVMRGNKAVAFVIAFLEVIIYTLAASQAFKYVNSPIVLVMYALGYASGSFIGITIDEKMSKGILFMMVITKDDNLELANSLRNNGYGVTSSKGYGMNGEKTQLTIVVENNKLKTLTELVQNYDKDAYIVNLDVKNVYQATKI